MATSTKGLSAGYLGVRCGITEKTARFFIIKLRLAVESGGKRFMNEVVHADEFVHGGHGMAVITKTEAT